MTMPALNHVLRQLHGLAGLHDGESLCDRQLLERFLQARDQAAFAELVRRHGPLVWGVCRRRLPRPQDAEDVFQATFLVLARKAADVGWRDSVGGWLHAVAHRLALKARSEAVRRRALERQARVLYRDNAVPDPSWREVGALLDDEMHSLPARLREPLVLCYLEGRTRDEAAQQLGWSLGTLKRRLERGRKLLHARLTRRGVTLSAVLLAGTLAPRRAPAALVALSARVVSAQSATTLGISARVAELADGAVGALTVGKGKVLTALILALGLLAGVAGPLAYQALTTPPPPQETEWPTPQEKQAGELRPAQPAAGRKPARFGGEKEEKTDTAIAEGLQWLVRHQASDGRWSLNDYQLHGHCNCTGTGAPNEIAGTAFGLLPLLGAGETHRTLGPYHPYAGNVRRGLDFLIRLENAKGDFGGGMYAHALATLTLCEAYRLTQDPELKEPAERAIAYIVDAQHPSKGGWRYRPGDAVGDTSITSWQVLALASGRRAGLSIPKEAWRLASSFLDRVGTPDGSSYGYVMPGQGSLAMTAGGLFCRLQLGWKPDHPGFVKGVARLQQEPPSPATPNLYYYHFATRVMARAGDKDWQQWEPKLRQLLLDGQDRGDDEKHVHQKGSWSPARDPFGQAGGRVMITSLALILLETCARSDPPLPPPKRRELNRDEIEALWKDLASDDFPRARRGMRTLAVDREKTVDFLKRHMKPVAAVDSRRIDRWIADLDAEEFPVRDNATAELTRLGDLAVSALRKTLQEKPSLEARRRIEDLLKGAEKQEGTPDRLRALRAVEVLTQIGTPEAKRILQLLAEGAAESGVTRAARAALAR